MQISLSEFCKFSPGQNVQIKKGEVIEMVFTEWQQVWFIQRFPVKRKNRRIWKVQSGRVVSDPGKENLRVKIHVSDTDSGACSLHRRKQKLSVTVGITGPEIMPDRFITKL